MKYTVSDICAVMEAWAPAAWAYDWDRIGLQSGAPGNPVSRVLTCLTINPGAVAAATKAGAQMIVSHHPLIWDPLRSLRSDAPHTKMLLEIARADIACLGAHTNLDVAPDGINALLAGALGLQGCTPLFPVDHARQVKLVTFVPESHLSAIRDAVSRAGAGIIGDYTHCSFSTPGTGTFLPGKAANPFSGAKGRVNEEPEHRFETLVDKARLPRVLQALFEAHPYEEPAYDVVSLENRESAVGLGLCGALEKTMRLDAFAAHVCRTLGLTHARVVGTASAKVRCVAVMGGAGGGYAHKVPDGIEVFVTGDVKYHDADAAAARGLALIDAGHAGTEKAIAAAIAKHLRRALPSLAVTPYIEKELFTIATP